MLTLALKNQQSQQNDASCHGRKNIFNDDVTNWSHWIFLTRKLAENDTGKVQEYTSTVQYMCVVQHVLYRCTGVQDRGVCSCEALKTTRTSQLVRDTRHHRVTASSWRHVLWWGCVTQLSRSSTSCPDEKYI